MIYVNKKRAQIRRKKSNLRATGMIYTEKNLYRIHRDGTKQDRRIYSTEKKISDALSICYFPDKKVFQLYAHYFKNVSHF